MTIPILCETPNCPNKSTEINRISGIEADALDTFYKNWGGGVNPKTTVRCAANSVSPPTPNPRKSHRENAPGSSFR